ncbi:MAG: tRNA-dihydrouridine synthase [Proteobacteria bacterium]|nr:tRNA-dihydrouridine synthase [Pseudomonadota bacterium]
MARLAVSVGRTALKNPLIAGSAEHMIEAGGVLRALKAGVGAVVVKSINEMERGKDQLQRAEYMLLDDQWREIPWSKDAPASAFMATRSGLTPQAFDAWLDQSAALDREAKAMDAYAIASLIVADLDRTVAMARQVEQAGLRILELNIGTPYASQAKGVVATELDPARVTMIVSAVRQAIKIPLWVKITGQSERVPELAAAAFAAGGEAVVMAGRLLGFIPDVETMAPYLGTTLGVGGYWNLPLTCHWLSVSRQALGPGKPLIATNGARTGLDVVRMMLAGAHAVEMASNVMLRGTETLSFALAELDAYLQRKNIGAAEIVGIATDKRKTFADMPLRTDNWKKYVADIDKK